MKVLEINNRRYLGNKYKLLDFIDEIMEQNQIECKTFLDLFAGTAVVAEHFARMGKTVYVNDILLSNYYAYESWFGSELISKRKLKHLIKAYNAYKPTEENYVSVQFKDKYFSEADCKKIGYIREDIEQIYKEGKLNYREYCYLITSLLYSMDRIANTVGHYDAYRKGIQLEDRFEMCALNVKTQPSKKNKIFRMNANELITKIKADVLFVDIPYNSRQYSDAYHLLENIAEWQKPEVYGQARKMDRNHLKSEYCMSKATDAFSHLIRHANCKYILVTYNNMGEKGNVRSQAKITDEQMIEILKQRGTVTIYEKDYNYYNTGKTKLKNHKERIFLCKVETRAKKERAKEQISHKKAIKEVYVKSPLNYTGGKYRLLPQIMKVFPKRMDTFLDLCCGGCNVGVNVNAKQIICMDSNKNIIDIYKLFQQYGYEAIVAKVEAIIKEYHLSNTILHPYEYYNSNSSCGLGEYNKEPYLKLRADYNERKQQDEEKLFLLLTLIFYSFNHQIRFNSMNEFNMPVGKRDFNGSIRKNLLAFCDRIKSQNIQFIHKRFEDIDVEELDQATFVYCDPPYLLAEASYNEDNGWTKEDEIRLLQFLQKLSDRNIKFALSNVIEHRGKKNQILLDWVKEHKFRMSRLNYNYNNANYHSKSKQNKTVEVLVRNY